MTWQDVAHKDVRDASRSRTLWIVSALVFVSFVGYSAVHGRVGEATFPAFLTRMATGAATLLPVLGIVLGYKSVVHERTSGSIALTLSFPHSRRDLVVGKFVGRSVVLLAPTLVAATLAGVVGAAQYGTEGALLFPWFLFATALYSVAFVAIAMALSMSTTVDRRITFGALGIYILLAQVWENFHSFTLLVLHRFDFEVLANMPDWALLFRLIKPAESYYRLLRAGFDVSQAGRYVGSGAPAYVDWWMALLLLGAWCAVPLVVGFRRFRMADL